MIPEIYRVKAFCSSATVHDRTASMVQLYTELLEPITNSFVSPDWFTERIFANAFRGGCVKVDLRVVPIAAWNRQVMGRPWAPSDVLYVSVAGESGLVLYHRSYPERVRLELPVRRHALTQTITDAASEPFSIVADNRHRLHPRIEAWRRFAASTEIAVAELNGQDDHYWFLHKACGGGKKPLDLADREGG